jgi:glycerophosphoryl diester phosphodiesterase
MAITIKMIEGKIKTVDLDTDDIDIDLDYTENSVLVITRKNTVNRTINIINPAEKSFHYLTLAKNSAATANVLWGSNVKFSNNNTTPTLTTTNNHVDQFDFSAASELSSKLFERSQALDVPAV